MSGNGSDFDQSDDDFADLLADDDDDIFAKKLSTNTSEKKSSSAPTISPTKKASKVSGDNSNSRRNSGIPFSSPERKKSTDFSLKDSPKHAAPQRKSDAFESDALSEFLNQNIPPKSKQKTSSPIKRTNDHEDLGFSKLSDDKPYKRNSNSSLSKDDEFEDDDILKSLDSETEDKSAPTSPRKRRGSFFDDFLKNLSPKNSAKKKSDSLKDKESKKDSSNKEINIDSPKNSANSSKELIQKRKESFLKQVSFKDSADDFLKTLSPIKKQSFSLENETSQKDTEPTTFSAGRSSRKLEKKVSSKDDDMDWSNFFKEVPKTGMEGHKSQPKNNESSLKDPLNDKLNTRRQSSGSEWLGLNDSPLTKAKSAPVTKRIPVDQKGDVEGFEEMSNMRKPQSAKENLNRSRRPRIPSTKDTSWLSEDFGFPLGENNKSSNVSETPKATEEYMNTELLNKDKTVTNEPKMNANIVKNRISKPTSETEFQQEHNHSNYDSSQLLLNSDQFPSKRDEFHQNIVSSNVMSNDIMNMQALLNKHILEKEQLIKSSEMMKSMYEDRIKTMELLHQDQLKSIQDSHKFSGNNLKNETDQTIKMLEDKINILNKEKQAYESDVRNKLTEKEKDHMNEIQKLKELHSIAVSQMKQDHEDALTRLNRLKDQEVEAVLGTQAHSRSLQHLTEQLEARTSELALLETKIEEKNQKVMLEKQSILESKEKDLKALQNRLKKQLEDADEERVRLQQLVLRLENRLQKHATEEEEERWQVQQMKAKLEVQQKYLNEEYKLKMECVEREKEKLRLNQNSLLQEQKVVLLQLAQERQQLSQERLDVELLSKRIKEEEAKFNARKLKDDCYIERQKQFIQQEENRLYVEKSNIKVEAQHFERDKDIFEREKQQFMNEKERFNDYSLKIKRKADEVELMSMAAAEEKEKARAEQSSAIRMKNEYQSKMQQISQQMQALMEKEHQLLEDKEKFTDEKYELESKKNSMICMKCKISTHTPMSVPPPNATPLMTYPIVNGFSSSMPQTFVDPNLVVWQISAQKDHAYLEEEISYLQSLKNSSKKQDKLHK